MEQKSPKNVLFVCYGNKDRSPTAERVFGDMLEERGYRTQLSGQSGLDVLINSAGLEAVAEGTTKMEPRFANEAEVIFTFSNNMKFYICMTYSKPMDKVIDLNITGRYQNGQKELIELLRTRLGPYVEKWYPARKQ